MDSSCAGDYTILPVAILLSRWHSSESKEAVLRFWLNLKHVRGMLLYGPPGSGKTLIAQNICKLLNAKEPLIINGPDVLNAFQGVSESKIRSLFKPAIEDENKYGAKSDLHIIIFDEIDWIVKIDGMKVLNNIFIIATINRKELSDEALLREGRIELHVKLEYPDEQGRLQILEINTRNTRQAFVLDKDVNLEEIGKLFEQYCCVSGNINSSFM
ncbi:hypothetical protein HYC85_023944 [Camellia sinensis]|uniref:Vesicle-fusing ATPase n=1 Tax=Camellia sinensis TaxID=4442 RepID=A0A7J7GHB1_CAMSI|nr:hypothetical protein HYC85_023944 [Camellia sinensis]